MQVVLCAINSSYSHSGLAIRLLEKNLKNNDIAAQMLEFTVNEPYQIILSGIYEAGADILCFSCYLWNIELVERIIEDYKSLSPRTKIVLGGPEVSFDAPMYMKRHENVACVVQGEGDEILPEVVRALQEGKTPASYTPGIMEDLNSLPFVYEGEENFENRLLYYETSRGCPFSCSYCLSSAQKGVRFLDVARVKRELSMICQKGAKTIKFLDRTFNCDKSRATEIFTFLMEMEGDFACHFEICAHLLDDALIALLAKAPKGRFQFEVGIQSTNADTIRAIGRPDENDRALDNLQKLKEAGNIPLHVDLIAGLPYDTWESILQGIDRVYPVCDELQLGFLKMLKGTRMRELAEELDYAYQKRPPYEVLYSPWLSYEEILRLKQIEWVINRYKNSGCFTQSLAVLLQEAAMPPSAFLTEFSAFLNQLHFFRRPHARKNLYEPFYQFAKAKLKDEPMEGFTLQLQKEYYMNERIGGLPFLSWRPRKVPVGEKIHALLHSEVFRQAFLPQYDNKPAAEVLKNVEFAIFSEEPKKILIFDFAYGKIQDVTKCFTVI